MPLIGWLPRRRTAVFHAVTTRGELVAAFAQMYPAVWDALQEQVPAEIGEVVAVYHSIGEDELVLSAGMEVADEFEPVEPLALLELGGCEAGMIDHFGPYLFDDFRRSQAQLESELAGQGRRPSGIVIERYLTMPDAEPDQSSGTRRSGCRCRSLWASRARSTGGSGGSRCRKLFSCQPGERR